MNHVLKKLALWKNGLSEHERKEFEDAQIDRIYELLKAKKLF